MKYWGYMPNDFINGQGVCVSLWTSGCPFHCEDCHNPETWDKEAGYDIPENLSYKLIKAINQNDIVRNFSILGGEPLAQWNREFINNIIKDIRKFYPSIKIFLWTGYTIEELKNLKDNNINEILNNVDTLIDGKYIKEERDITIPLRGSRNQRVLKKGIDF